jgi:hypothetical protein
VIACQRRSSVYAAFVRQITVMVGQHAAMGEKSGEWGEVDGSGPHGFNCLADPCHRVGFEVIAHHLCPGCRWGTSPYGTKASKAAPSTQPSTSMAATPPTRPNEPTLVTYRPRCTGLAPGARCPRGARP